ncbi:MAG: tRNA dihydrouridine synthase DusB [Ruminococcus sp.]|nr:tRNA dihydrouridine synthase DusB [Ruminococcus sp.]
MKIGNVNIDGYACLAPMAGVADKAFRELCMDFGSCYCVSEMVSSKGISYNSAKSAKLMELSENEHPCAVQIFGNEPHTMAKAARFALQYKPEIIDINMGCPAPKISSNGAGAALMKDPKLCGEIVREVVNAVSIPVTVKIRKGFDDDNINAVQVAAICEENGAKAVTIHGRTKTQYYSGVADLDIIKDVKNALSIPVIGNGDIVCAQDAKRMYEYTGCDLVMVGRGALGNPWVFSEINALFNLDKFKKPTFDEKMMVMKRHIESLAENKGEYIGMKEARAHIPHYFKDFKGAAKLRNDACKVSTIDDLYKLIDKARATCFI